MKERDKSVLQEKPLVSDRTSAQTSQEGTGYHFDNAVREVMLSLTPGACSLVAVETSSTQPISVKVTGETTTMKKLIAIFVALSLFTVLTAASCGGSAGGAGTGGNGGTGVHMGSVNFVQPSVTISKGSSLNLIDDVAVLHIIGNGSWVNNAIKAAREPNAPVVNNVSISSAGQSISVGPFTAAGTYHLYCSVHLNMNLTVIVQ